MPKWRPFTCLIVVINVLFLVWIIAGVRGGFRRVRKVGSAKQACEAGTAVGATIGVGIIVDLSFLVESSAYLAGNSPEGAGRVPSAAPVS
jgi:hypothetical protein